MYLPETCIHYVFFFFLFSHVWASRLFAPLTVKPLDARRPQMNKELQPLPSTSGMFTSVSIWPHYVMAVPLSEQTGAPALLSFYCRLPPDTFPS